MMRLFAQILAGVAIALSATATLNQPSYAQGATFYCDKSNGVPTTFARTQDGKNLPMIRWVTDYFQGTSLTPLRRCQEVSRRFQSNYDNGTLRYIKAGMLKGLPVVCAAAQLDATCTDRTLLFTLKAGSNPDATARQLFDRRALAAGQIVNQGGKTSNEPVNIEPVNIDVEAYLYFK
ncbi:COP23 domain-containing protein [Iningainema tapete]|uniref:Uncharacterized protein n=1 Tax=Iningainema tapete BLCC-T55 TaxID=2748662 RepID=A0A8J7C9C2_9CYAN|nr:COP23 domain-containing protein [Iningainema tapete]MBD2775756.1 hypothetical protein [Iningainema tapete BLCC-T55]